LHIDEKRGREEKERGRVIERERGER